ncbi:hypothetical protein ACFWD7_36840 [Streptomyces mirabilis]|uniref:hypothetical protein n=1 Tax=Streptomyces mirabilis TaxID=68239 RepID=UPI003687727F
MTSYDHDDFADLGEDDIEQLEGLSDEQLAAAFEALHGPPQRDDPLDAYATPVTRKRKPSGEGRKLHDLPPL